MSRIARHGLWLAALALAGCGGGYGGPDLRSEFPSLQVTRIGDSSPVHSDFQDIAVGNAVRYAVESGVPETAIQRATVESVRQIGVPIGGASGYPMYYEVWLKVQGCPKSIHMRASFTGRLAGLDDPAGCLAGAARPQPGAAPLS